MDDYSQLVYTTIVFQEWQRRNIERLYGPQMRRDFEKVFPAGGDLVIPSNIILGEN